LLSAAAYTLRQKARLAVSLAWVGGFVDAVGFLLLSHIFISNMTGNTARLAENIARLSWPDALHFGFPIAMFFLGCCLSGLITVGGPRCGVRSVYAFALSIEVALLCSFISVHNLVPDPRGGHLFLQLALLATAMGLQNATITQIAGNVVRTTHVTGVITDFGLEGVQLLFWFHDRTRGRLRARLRRAFRLSAKHPSLQRLALLASIWGSFLAGAVLGVWSLVHFNHLCLIGPVCFLVFIITIDLVHPIAEMHRVDHHRHDQELRKFGIDPGLLPREVGVYRIRGEGLRRQRAPDLGKLAERMGSDHQVVMLILADNIDLDDNNLVGLEASLKALRSRQCDLVLCVTESRLFVRISEGSLGEELGSANLCSDPEFAVARAIELCNFQNATH
jgi:uncharacterized membrane protein YoaK (UPF0700 family)